MWMLGFSCSKASRIFCTRSFHSGWLCHIVNVTFSPEAAGALLELPAGWLVPLLPAAGTAPGAQAASSVAITITTAIIFESFLDIFNSSFVKLDNAIEAYSTGERI